MLLFISSSKLMVSLSSVTLIKLFLFFLTLLEAFSPSLKHAKFTAFMRNFFVIFLDVLTVVYTPRFYIIEVKVKLTFICFSLKTNYYSVIESIHVFILLAMMFFITLFWYKERMLSLFTKYIM